jgi:hypothetical protein
MRSGFAERSEHSKSLRFSAVYTRSRPWYRFAELNVSLVSALLTLALWFLLSRKKIIGLHQVNKIRPEKFQKVLGNPGHVYTQPGNIYNNISGGNVCARNMIG